MSGEIEVNEPVRVYDTSGPWGDPEFHGDVEQGLPPLRAKWIRERGDVEEIEGRKAQPIDDGFLSEVHARSAQRKRRTPNAQWRGRARPPGAPSASRESTFRHATLVRAAGHHHARDGIHRDPRKHGERGRLARTVRRLAERLCGNERSPPSTSRRIIRREHAARDTPEF